MAKLQIVSGEVNINKAAFAKLDKAIIQSLEMTAEALHTEVVQAQVMPRDTGHLQNESTFVDRSQSSKGVVYLVSSTPYARRLYFHPEYNFTKTENPNAKGLWLEDWIDGDKKDFFDKAFAAFLKRNGGTG